METLGLINQGEWITSELLWKQLFNGLKGTGVAYGFSISVDNTTLTFTEGEIRYEGVLVKIPPSTLILPSNEETYYKKYLVYASYDGYIDLEEGYGESLDPSTLNVQYVRYPRIPFILDKVPLYAVSYTHLTLPTKA